MKRFMITTSVGLLAVAFAIAGCGGSAATTAPAPASNGSQSAAPAASAGSVASAAGQASAGPSQAAAANGGSVEDGIGHPVNICDLLPVATVASITGEPLTVSKEDDTADYKIYAMRLQQRETVRPASTVSVLALDAAAGFDSGMQADSNAKLINGLGDKAFSSILGVYALFGNVQITVSNLQSDDAAITLIKTLQPKL